MDRDVIEIQFTPAERSLILHYGYPFEKIEQALKACESSRNVETIPVDLFELERLTVDLSISINDMDGGTVQRKLSDLCDRQEAAEAFGDGLLEEFWPSSSARTSRC